MFGRLFLFVIFPLFTCYLYITLLPFNVLIGLTVIFIVAFFMPTLTTSVRPALIFSVIALALLAAYISYASATPSVWVEGHPILKYITSITDWDLLPAEFWKYSAAFVSVILTFISAWAGDHFAGQIIITKEGFP